MKTALKILLIAFLGMATLHLNTDAQGLRIRPRIKVKRPAPRLKPHFDAAKLRKSNVPYRSSINPNTFRQIRKQEDLVFRSPGLKKPDATLTATGRLRVPEPKAPRISRTLAAEVQFKRGSRVFTLKNGTPANGWLHIYDDHIDLTDKFHKTKFGRDMTQSDILEHLALTIKHGKKSNFYEFTTYTYRIKHLEKYRRYRVTVNLDNTIRTFHALSR